MPSVNKYDSPSMTASLAKPRMGIFWLFFILMLLLHQDFWNWSMDGISYLGMPIGLFYHAIFSIACSFLGAWSVIRAWPEKWEKYAEEKEGTTLINKQHSVE